jgi:hypothetical protein
MLEYKVFLKHLAIGTHTPQDVRDAAKYLYLSGMPVQLARSYLNTIVKKLHPEVERESLVEMLTEVKQNRRKGTKS